MILKHLCILLLKLFHECNQRFHTFLWHCIINTCSHTAYGSVSFQVHKTCCLVASSTNFASISLSPVTKGTFIRERSSWHNGAMEKLAVIKEIVKDLCFLLVAFLHLFQTAHFLQPFENFTAYIDAICSSVYYKGNQHLHVSYRSSMVGVPGRTSSVIRSSRIMAITIPAGPMFF